MKKYGWLVLAILLALLAVALPASAKDNRRDNRSHSDVSNGRNGRRISENRGGYQIPIPQIEVRGIRRNTRNSIGMRRDDNRGRNYRRNDRYDSFGRLILEEVVRGAVNVGTIVVADKIVNRRPSRQEAQEEYIADQQPASEIQTGNIYSYRNTTQHDVYVGYPQSAEGFYVTAGGVAQASSLLPVYGKFNGTFGPARVIWQGNIALITAPTRGN